MPPHHPPPLLAKGHNYRSASFFFFFWKLEALPTSFDSQWLSSTGCASHIPIGPKQLTLNLLSSCTIT